MHSGVGIISNGLVEISDFKFKRWLSQCLERVT